MSSSNITPMNSTFQSNKTTGKQNDTRKILSMQTINPNILTMEYAVRGPIVLRAVEIEQQLKEKQQQQQFPFSSVIKANIGDAHAMGQQPVTFIRQVLSCTICPDLMKIKNFPSDVYERASALLKECGGQSVGSYSQSTGLDLIRRHIAEFIDRRDALSANRILPPCDFNNVCLSAGASEAIRSVLELFINYRDEAMNTRTFEEKRPGIMVPIPQYPLYSATIEEFNLGLVNYYLNEEKNWGLDIDELERSVEAGRKQFGGVYALVVINPGNPTGQVLSKENIQAVIKFAHRHKLFVFADEVYQENVYAEGAQFHSFRKVLYEMGEPYSSDVELASFYSCSKGYMGECGIRGGYVEFLNFDPSVYGRYKTMISAKLCPTVLGQITMDCIVKPPMPGEPSYDLWIKEKTAILVSLKKRATLVTQSYNTIKGVSLRPVQGAMYAFPRIILPERFLAHAKDKEIEPDFLYAKQLLEATGVCIVPGSGFGQFPGTHHFRTTILPQEPMFEEMINRFRNFHEKFLVQWS